MGSHNDSSYIVPQERMFVNNAEGFFKKYSQMKKAPGGLPA
jgi:hypothetical protein